MGTGRMPMARQEAQAAGALPRTADGKPDLSGIWQAVTTANWNIQAHAAEDGVGARGVRIDEFREVIDRSGELGQ